MFRIIVLVYVAGMIIHELMLGYQLFIKKNPFIRSLSQMDYLFVLLAWPYFSLYQVIYIFKRINK